MTDFERRLREMASLTPNMTLTTALALADRGDEPVPYPADPSDSAATAMWASQFPEVMVLIDERRPIDAIKVLRGLSPADHNGRGLSLRDAKDAVDTLRNP